MKNINIVSDKLAREQDTDVIIVNGEAFTYKASGLTRRVYANKDKTSVIKIPLKESYTYANKEEVEIYENASENVKAQMAETKMLPNGYIRQEFLWTLDDPLTDEMITRKITVEEIRFARSCRNDVGFDKNGVMKCHDLPEFLKY
jgi:vacuolar-type H+-ATPase subunit F/Vma7